MTTRTSASYRLTLTVGLCFLVALMEGLDLQAAGIAAVGIAHAFALDKMQMGWIFSAGILGLLPGALVGGMLADRYGRKRILIASVALFGLFSLATAISWDFSSLVFARLMTGVGLGAALPNLIALTSEAAGPRFRGTAVSLMYCGVPIGAALAAALGFSGLASAWQTVFWVGGVIPLLLIAFGLIEPKRELSAIVTPAAEKCTFLRAVTAKGVLPLFLLVRVLYICTQTKSMTISSIVKTEGMGDATTSAMILSMATFGALLGGLALPTFCRRVKRYRTPVLVLVLSLMTVTNLMNSVLLIGAGYCVGTMAFMMNLNLMTLRASRLFPPEEASRAVSLIQCADKLGVFLATYFTTFCSWLVQALGINYSIYRAPIIGVLIVYLIASVVDAVCNGPEAEG